MTRFGFHALCAAIGIPLGLSVAMALDRTPPYYRDSGEILAAPPEDCDLPPNTASASIIPGHCVYVKWTIRIVKECRPAAAASVGRSIESKGIVHILPKIPNHFGPETGRKISNPIIRPWIYPAWAEPGPAVYRSSACYVCPFGPIDNQVQRLLPVCVNTPSIPHDVAERP